MLIKIWRRNCNSFNFSLSPALDQAAPWAVSLEGRRQINLVSLNTTIGVLKGPAYGGHSLAHQSCSKNLYQSIKNVPCLGWILKPGQLSNSLCQEGTEDIFQSLVSIVMITIYMWKQRDWRCSSCLELGGEGYPWRDKCTCMHIHTDAATKGKCASK